MKFLNLFGFNPLHETHCIKEHNTILKETIDKFKSGNFDKEAFFKKYMWNENQPQQWQTTCIGTTNIFFNFLTWHLEKEIKTQKTGDKLVPIMDSMLREMSKETNTNVLKYDAYMVDRWNIFEIGQKLFGVDTNNGNNVNICTHLQNHVDSEQVTQKKRRKSDVNNEREGNVTQKKRRKSDVNNEREGNVNKKKKKKTTREKNKSSIYIDDEAKGGGKDMEGSTNEATMVDATNIDDDNNNEIVQQDEEQQVVNVKEREPINEITEVTNVHDLTIYTLKVAIERSKSYLEEKSHQEYMDALLNDVNQLDRMNASAKIDDIDIPDTLATFVKFKKV